MQLKFHLRQDLFKKDVARIMSKNDPLLIYFNENVLRSYTDYKTAADKRSAGRGNDLYLAKKAAENLYHFREHLPNKPGYNTIKAKCPDYQLVRDITNASKHKDFDKPRPGADIPLIQDLNSVYECLISTTYHDSEGEFRDSHKGVFIKLLDGTERDFFEIATNVVNMWCTELHVMGVIEKPRKFDYARRKEPLTRSECDMSFDLNFERAAPAQFIMKMMKYNYEKQTLEPEDISDKGFEFRVYDKDIYIAEARLVGPDEYVSFEIKLSQNEVNELQSYRTNEERQAVFFEKAISQGANEGGVFNKDGTPKIGKDGKPLKVKVALKTKESYPQ